MIQAKVEDLKTRCPWLPLFRLGLEILGVMSDVFANKSSDKVVAMIISLENKKSLDKNLITLTNKLNSRWGL